MSERLVVALGGNALIRQGDRGTITEQAARSLAAMAAISQTVTAERQLVITHGNGPTVGNILIRQQLARHVTPAMPLDVCGAESQGNIGYLLERALTQVLRQRGIQRPVATLLSLVEVDPHDPAFVNPSKPIGPFLSAAEAEELGRSVPVARDAARGFRRVVASPAPQRIFESAAIEALLAAGVIVITLGGGGIPVVLDSEQQLSGVEAVIDKDLSSSVLARAIGASNLIILTDIDYVYLDFLSAQRRAVQRMRVSEAEDHLRRGEFLPGSMAPKIEAGIAFLYSGGQRVLIGLPEELPQLLQGAAGTEISP
ncbi:MAG: carbamate kinase [Deltaproteobacteria bacterium]|nr:carbamate kinase [Deltaproteobacteria bacterium]